MNFFQKVRLLFGTDFKIVSSAIPSWREGKAVAPETNFTSLVKHGWRKNELIYACVSTKCNTASQTTLRVYNQRTDAEIEEHPLRALLQRPNPRMSEFDFWYSVFLYQDFAGIAYYEKVRSRSGRTVQLWPMRPDWVRPQETSRGLVKFYEYGIPGIDPVHLPAEDVLSFSLFDPLNQYMGYPPVAVAARSGDLDNAVTDYLRLLFQEGGVPPDILKTTKNINEAIAQRAREIWKQYYGGYQKWTEPAVLGNDMEYQQTGLGVAEMGLEQLDRRDEVRICQVLHVPPTVVHTLVGMERSILDNAQSFELSWWMDDLFPMYKNLNDSITNQLLPEYGDDSYSKWDFSEVPAIRAQIEATRKNRLEEFRMGAITRNQFNEAAGLPTLGPRGDVYLLSAAMIEVPAGMLLPRPEPVEEEPEEEPEEEIQEEEEDTEKSLSPAGSKAADPDDIEQRTQSEEEIKEGMTEFLADELERIEKAVAETYGDRSNGKGTAPVKPETVTD